MQPLRTTLKLPGGRWTSPIVTPDAWPAAKYNESVLCVLIGVAGTFREVGVDPPPPLPGKSVVSDSGVAPTVDCGAVVDPDDPPPQPVVRANSAATAAVLPARVTLRPQATIVSASTCTVHPGETGRGRTLAHRQVEALSGEAQPAPGLTRTAAASARAATAARPDRRGGPQPGAGDGAAVRWGIRRQRKEHECGTR
ncbi:hypothetical protein GCM10010441_20600 [Kitasatospora paracochleata]